MPGSGSRQGLAFGTGCPGDTGQWSHRSDLRGSSPGKQLGRPHPGSQRPLSPDTALGASLQGPPSPSSLAVARSPLWASAGAGRAPGHPARTPGGQGVPRRLRHSGHCPPQNQRQERRDGMQRRRRGHQGKKRPYCAHSDGAESKAPATDKREKAPWPSHGVMV